MYTYKENRKCLYCGTGIADQAHGTRKFCPREELSDGSIKSCKDDYHITKNKVIDARLRSIALFQRKMNQRIEALVNAKGFKVQHAQINRYGINLFRPIQFEFVDGLYKGWFLEYLIERIEESNYKISKHGILF